MKILGFEDGEGSTAKDETYYFEEVDHFKFFIEDENTFENVVKAYKSMLEALKLAERRVVFLRVAPTFEICNDFESGTERFTLYCRFSIATKKTNTFPGTIGT